MDYERTLKYLNELGQSHLLEYFGELDEEKRRILLDEIEKVNFSVVENINKTNGEKCTGKYSPCPAKTIKDIQTNRNEYEKEGIRLLKSNKVAAVLLAGGQGTRLGFDKPKGMFDIGISRTLYIFEQLMNNVKKVTSLTGAFFPLFIMTSTVNNSDTIDFFEKHNFFGYPREKVHFYIQDTEPACDFNGKVLLADKHKIALSPNGNGGWYSSLLNSGLGDVLKKEGVEWINVFGVDNVLQKICDPVFVGATSLSGCECASKVVKKACAEEKVGVLLELDDKPCVVEYYEIPPELAGKRGPDGELVYPYGVILNYLFKVEGLDRVISKKLPYHLAKKAVAHIENGKLVTPKEPNGYKFETLVVDMVREMNSCLAFEVEREKEFAPVKNKTGVDSVDSARDLLVKNGVKL